ncbi:Gfo/Idh/MocA family oxidoreductase [Gilvimarinus sp. SDUM040013]|uniref:Gfo/Idh/MocA family oxidoreductase n=1 Tax=Gilvimarinus gilvus TaxID=3058038 RepID=A0ABU4S708_9GAMM|nr:Gfo/Idh/MocA family oxidoreductase [Gilvimarinus sp. SDUM040013]MDO3385832.1 Gfo/Idh/MocA family oxidoreductase [Gilvimarinus sp. SDUM040013]MDX6851379.1 Gfo/Idh/MocA family oxidoreductase [Gilvimarinus sp. SDUM040013]
MSQTLNVALASYGMSGKVFHAPLIAAHPFLRLASVLQRNDNSALQRYPKVKIVRSFDKLISDPKIHIVVVNTPNVLHYPMARDALRAGKNVVLEKPFTAELDEGRELIELAQQQGLMLTVFHNRRLQSGFNTAKKLLQEKRLGKINTFAVTIDRFRPEPGPKKWKEEPNPGAGLLYDLGSHLIDECLTLFGLPKSVYADLRIERNGAQTCDYFDARLDYPSHKCLLKASMLAREPAPAYLIHGDKGSYLKPLGDVQESRLAAGQIPQGDNWADEQPHEWGHIRTDQGRETYPTVAGNYQYFYDNVYRHLTHGDELLVIPDQALVTIGLIKVLERSAHERTCIELA